MKTAYVPPGLEIRTCGICKVEGPKQSLADYHRQGWDWFTGWFPYTTSVCSGCANSDVHKRLVKESQSEMAHDEWHRIHRKQPKHRETA
jgi:hypothetical protein